MDASVPIVQADVTVIGAGMAGLSCALALARAGARVLVLERRAEAGGVVRSARAGERGQYLLELGPNTFSSHPSQAIDLARELGLGERMMARPMRDYDRFLWSGQRLVKAPTGPLSFLTTPMLTVGERLRVVAEPLLGGPRAVSTVDGDTALGPYVREHFGAAFHDAFLVPIISGIYAANPEHVSLRAAFPKMFAHVEGARSAVLGGGRGGRAGGPKQPRKPRLLATFPDGLKELPRAMAAAVTELGSRVVYGVQAMELRPAEAESAEPAAGLTAPRWMLRGEHSSGAFDVATREVVVAAPLWKARQVIREVAPLVASELDGIPSNNMVVVHMALPLDGLSFQPRGFGFLVPRGRGLRILGGLFSSAMFAGRAPEGETLITCFMGGELDPSACDLDDEALVREATGDLTRALGYRAGQPLFTQVTRWSPALPVYRTGHPQRVERIRKALPEGLHLTGNYLEAISLPESSRQGYELGEALAASIPDLRKRPAFAFDTHPSEGFYARR